MMSCSFTKSPSCSLRATTLSLPTRRKDTFNARYDETASTNTTRGFLACVLLSLLCLPLQSERVLRFCSPLFTKGGASGQHDSLTQHSLTHSPNFIFFFRNWRLKEVLSGVTWFHPCFLRQDDMLQPPFFVSVILKSTRRNGTKL
jgi:hypothetical protein